MSNVDEIILGEGVAIDTGAAPVTLRLASGAIDAIVAVVLLWVGLIVVGSVLPMVNGAWATAVTIGLIVMVFVVIPATVETLTRGLSVGRLAVGLRVVRDDSGPITARHAFGRAVMAILEIYGTGGVVAVTASMLSERGKRLGDMMVGTYAMRTRGGRKALPPVQMPYSLAHWAATADIARLPDGVALTARLFLSRAATMNVASRARLGADIYHQMLPHVSPPAPEGTHIETFIAAVVATRRDREYAAAVRTHETDAVEAARLARLPYGITDSDN